VATSDWVAPDAPGGSFPPVPSPQAAPSPPPLRDGATPSAGDAFRPRAFLELLDGSFALMRRNARTVVVLVAVVVIPPQLAAALLQRGRLGGGDFGTDGFVLLLGGSVAGALLASLGLPFLAAGLTHVAVAERRGITLPVGQVLRRTFSRTWALVASWVLVRLMYAVGSCMVVGPLVLMPFCLVIAPAIAAERLGPLAGIGRSFTLGMRTFGASMGFAYGSGLVALLLSAALSGLPAAFAQGGGELGWLLSSVATLASSALLLPFVAGATALFYVEQRVRSEGLDLELAVAQAFPQ
jgi:hypothetical protein